MIEPSPADPTDTEPKLTDELWTRPMAPKIVRFKDLSRCGDEIWIEHEGKLYRLQSTRQGKLVLTK